VVGFLAFITHFSGRLISSLHDDDYSTYISDVTVAIVVCLVDVAAKLIDFAATSSGDAEFVRLASALHQFVVSVVFCLCFGLSSSHFTGMTDVSGSAQVQLSRLQQFAPRCVISHAEGNSISDYGIL
jgi:hypothetical protein